MVAANMKRDKKRKTTERTLQAAQEVVELEVEERCPRHCQR